MATQYIRYPAITSIPSGAFPLLAPAGTAAAPSYSFLLDPNTGMYNPSADTIGFSAGGTLRVSIGSTSVLSTVPFVGPVGSVSAPTLGFASETNTGFYLASAQTIGVTSVGAQVATFDPAKIVSAVPFQASAGTVNNPTYGFNATAGAGMYISAADILAFAASSTKIVEISSLGLNLAAGQIFTQNGGAASAALSIGQAGNTGLYLVSAGVLGVTASGTTVGTFSSAGIASGAGQFVSQLGAVGAPGYSFTSDLNTGMWSSAADTLDFATNGVNQLQLSTSFTTSYLPLKVQNGIITMILGADSGATTLTNNTTKGLRMSMYAYDLSEEPVALMFLTPTVSVSDLKIGGGTSSLNACTSVNFYTAATNTTVTGTLRVQITTGGNLVHGLAAIATTATDGFIYFASCAGTPTGVPTAFAGRVPMVYDTSADKFWIYNGSAWKSVTLS